LCVLLTLVSAVEGWLWRIDQTLYDGVLSAWTQPASDDVVIVSIDDASLASIGRWPWSRRVHAALIDLAREAGARAVVLDLILDAPSPDDPGADMALARAIHHQGRVVLPMTQATTGAMLSGEVRPLDVFADAAAAIGHSQVEFDPDGIARSVYLWEGFGAARHPQLSSPCCACSNRKRRTAFPLRPRVMTSTISNGSAPTGCACPSPARPEPTPTIPTRPS
jgi:CHASE2 domain-containing sensor protein